MLASRTEAALPRTGTIAKALSVEGDGGGGGGAMILSKGIAVNYLPEEKDNSGKLIGKLIEMRRYISAEVKAMQEYYTTYPVGHFDMFGISASALLKYGETLSKFPVANFGFVLPLQEQKRGGVEYGGKDDDLVNLQRIVDEMGQLSGALHGFLNAALGNPAMAQSFKSVQNLYDRKQGYLMRRSYRSQVETFLGFVLDDKNVSTADVRIGDWSDSHFEKFVEGYRSAPVTFAIMSAAVDAAYQTLALYHRELMSEGKTILDATIFMERLKSSPINFNQPVIPRIDGSYPTKLQTDVYKTIATPMFTYAPVQNRFVPTAMNRLEVVYDIVSSGGSMNTEPKTAAVFEIGVGSKREKDDNPTGDDDDDGGGTDTEDDERGRSKVKRVDPIGPYPPPAQTMSRPPEPQRQPELERETMSRPPEPQRQPVMERMEEAVFPPIDTDYYSLFDDDGDQLQAQERAAEVMDRGMQLAVEDVNATIQEFKTGLEKYLDEIEQYAKGEFGETLAEYTKKLTDHFEAYKRSLQEWIGDTGQGNNVVGVLNRVNQSVEENGSRIRRVDQAAAAMGAIQTDHTERIGALENGQAAIFESVANIGKIQTGVDKRVAEVGNWVAGHGARILTLEHDIKQMSGVASGAIRAETEGERATSAEIARAMQDMTRYVNRLLDVHPKSDGPLPTREFSLAPTMILSRSPSNATSFADIGGREIGDLAVTSGYIDDARGDIDQIISGLWGTRKDMRTGRYSGTIIPKLIEDMAFEKQSRGEADAALSRAIEESEKGIKQKLVDAVEDIRNKDIASRGTVVQQSTDAAVEAVRGVSTRVTSVESTQAKQAKEVDALKAANQETNTTVTKLRERIDAVEGSTTEIVDDLTKLVIAKADSTVTDAIKKNVTELTQTVSGFTATLNNKPDEDQVAGKISRAIALQAEEAKRLIGTKIGKDEVTAIVEQSIADERTRRVLTDLVATSVGPTLEGMRKIMDTMRKNPVDDDELTKDRLTREITDTLVQAKVQQEMDARWDILARDMKGKNERQERIFKDTVDAIRRDVEVARQRPTVEARHVDGFATKCREVVGEFTGDYNKRIQELKTDIEKLGKDDLRDLMWFGPGYGWEREHDSHPARPSDTIERHVNSIGYVLEQRFEKQVAGGLLTEKNKATLAYALTETDQGALQLVRCLARPTKDQLQTIQYQDYYRQFYVKSIYTALQSVSRTSETDNHYFPLVFAPEDQNCRRALTTMLAKTIENDTEFGEMLGNAVAGAYASRLGQIESRLGAAETKIGGLQGLADKLKTKISDVQLSLLSFVKKADTRLGEWARALKLE